VEGYQKEQLHQSWSSDINRHVTRDTRMTLSSLPDILLSHTNYYD